MKALGKSNYKGSVMRIWTLETVRQRCRIEGDCWIWVQGVNSQGYPQAHIMGYPQLVGRWVLNEKSGVAFPRSFVVQQRCENMMCVSPHCVWGKRRGVILRDQYRTKVRSREKTLRQIEVARATAAQQGWLRYSAAQVAAVLAAPFDTPRAVLSEQTGVSADSISRIRHGRQRTGTGAGSSVFDLRWLQKAAA